MVDGRIVIDVIAKGQGDVDRLNQSFQTMEGKAQKAGVSALKLATAMGAVKVASAVFKALANAMDGAITRFDTFQRFPKVLDAFGYSTKASSNAITALSHGIEGLPTPLDEVVKTTQRLTAMTGNLHRSTQLTLALNNAFLASGSSASDASRGTEQYLQQLAKGEVDLQSWRTLQESMAVSLQRVAEQMGFTGEAATTDLYDALKAGDVTFAQFQKNLIELGTGTGELAKLARVNSEGIATSFGNLHTAVVKGLANMLDKLNDLSVEVTGSNIAQNIDKGKAIINLAFKAIGNAIDVLTPVVKVLAEAFKITYKTAVELAPVLIGLSAAYATFKILEKVVSWSGKHNELLDIAISSGKNLVLATQAEIAALALKTGATNKATLAQLANTGSVSLGTLAYGVFTGAINLTTASTILLQKAMIAFEAILTALTGGLWLVVLAVGAVVAVGAALIKNWKRETEAGKELNNVQKDVVSSSEALVSASKSAMQGRYDEVKSIESNSNALKRLADETVELANKKNRTKAEAKLLKDNIEQLNKSVDDLNLSYDEENDLLSKGTQQIYNKIDAFSNTDKMIQVEEQLIAIMKEEEEIALRVADITELRKEWAEKLEAGTVTSREAKKATKELDEQEKELAITQTALKTEYENTKQTQMALAEELAEVSEATTVKQMANWDELSEVQQNAIEKMRETYADLTASATNAFEQIDTESELYLSTMVDNLKHNQLAVAEWGENQAKLLAWAGENGYDSFIPFIESMGLDQAGVLKNMVGGIDESNVEQAEALKELAETYDKGFTVATEAGDKALREGLEAIPETVRELIVQPSVGLNQEIKQAFEVSGRSITDGFELGVEKGIDGTVKQMQDMAKRQQDEYERMMGIHSPSTVFEGYATNMIEGLLNGFDKGIGKLTAVTTNMKKIFDDAFKAMSDQSKVSFSSLVSNYQDGLNKSEQLVIKSTDKQTSIFKKFFSSLMQTNKEAFNSLVSATQSGMANATNAVSKGADSMTNQLGALPSRFNYYGVQASYGLASGIYAGASNAINAASWLANQVTNTLQSALQIHSPSVKIKNLIGKMIPAGMAEGIKENANIVKDELKNMINLPKMNAESLINFGRSATKGLVDRITENNKTINNKPQVNIYATWNGKEDIRRTMQTIDWETYLEGGGY